MNKNNWYRLSDSDIGRFYCEEDDCPKTNEIPPLRAKWRQWQQWQQSYETARNLEPVFLCETCYTKYFKKDKPRKVLAEWAQLDADQIARRIGFEEYDKRYDALTVRRDALVGQ